MNSANMTLLNDLQLQKLAENEKNKVMKWTYDNPEEIMSSDECKTLIHEIRTRYLVLKKENPGLTDDQIRHRLCQEKYKFKKFAKLHGLNFESCTSKETSDEKLEKIFFALYLHKHLEIGVITQEQEKAMIHQFAMAPDKQRNQVKNDICKQLERLRLKTKNKNLSSSFPNSSSSK